MLLLWLSCLLLVTSPTLADNKSNKNQQERKDDQRVKEAQQAVETARKQLNAAEKRLREALQQADQADTRQDRAKIAVQKAKERAESQLEGAAGIRAAIDRMKAAEGALATASEPIVKGLRETQAFQAAERAAQAAKERLPQLRLDVTLDDAERETEFANLNKVLQAPRQLEQAAIDADATCRARKAELQAAQAEVAKLREAVRDKLEQQPEVKQALEELAGAGRDLAQAQRKASAARQDLSQERRELASKQQAVDRAKAADKRNDKNNKPKKKK
jgi:hypothetical protein